MLCWFKYDDGGGYIHHSGAGYLRAVTSAHLSPEARAHPVEGHTKAVSAEGVKTRHAPTGLNKGAKATGIALMVSCGVMRRLRS